MLLPQPSDPGLLSDPFVPKSPREPLFLPAVPEKPGATGEAPEREGKGTCADWGPGA